MTTNDKLREALSDAVMLLREVSRQFTQDDDLPDDLLPRIDEFCDEQDNEALAASEQEPTTCGYCTYEESDGSLIEQCQACKDKDSKQEPSAKGYCEYCCAELPMPKVQSGKQEPSIEEKLHDWHTTLERASRQEPQAQAAEPDLQNIEQYRMQMVNISTAALGYWREGDGIHPDYDTLALRDVSKLYDKYAAASEAIAKKDAALDACMEALESVDGAVVGILGLITNTSPNEDSAGDKVRRAITQAKEARKS